MLDSKLLGYSWIWEASAAANADRLMIMRAIPHRRNCNSDYYKNKNEE